MSGNANRLTQVTEGPLTTQFAYNGDGARISKTVGGHTTQYVLDLATTLPVVISDTDAVYLYGLDILAQQQAERLYYFHDGLGSVRQLVDTTGQIETNYAYDPFGMPVMGGDGSNPYQFTGEAWDAEVELLYLRARYYQPEVGRFVTKDPWSGLMGQPGTLNRFAYVTNNPVNQVDPRGLEGGELGGICPECKEMMDESDSDGVINGVIDYFSDDESEEIWIAEQCPVDYDEWVKEWPDPWIDDPKGWNWADEFEASQLKRELFRQSKEVYGEKYRLLVGYAFVRGMNNPLREDELGLCAGSGPKNITLKNRTRQHWLFFIKQLGMDTSQTTNYEPLWLDMKMEYHPEDLGIAQRDAYDDWYCPWASEYGTEYEEVPHFYDPGVGE
jgi:RHS repeat-associated protein